MPVRPLAECAVLLAGATSGIGLESAVQLARAGCRRIVLNGRNPEKAAAAASEVGAKVPEVDVRAVAADTSVPEQARRVVAEALDAFGRIDVLVNAASGGLTPRPFHEVPLEEVDEFFDSHFRTVLNVCHAAYPTMMEARGGSIINFGADAAKLATPGETVQGAAQAAVVMFTRTLALEAARFGIRVNCVSPSITRDTGSYDRMMADPFSHKLFQKAEGRAHLGVAAAKDIAPLVVFLAGPGSSHLTGQAISVNGGISAA